MIWGIIVLSPVVNPLSDPQPELLKKNAKHAANALRERVSISKISFLVFIVCPLCMDYY